MYTDLNTNEEYGLRTKVVHIIDYTLRMDEVAVLMHSYAPPFLNSFKSQIKI